MYFRFSKLHEREKDPLLSRRRFIQRFPNIYKEAPMHSAKGCAGNSPSGLRIQKQVAAVRVSCF